MLEEIAANDGPVCVRRDHPGDVEYLLAVGDIRFLDDPLAYPVVKAVKQRGNLGDGKIVVVAWISDQTVRRAAPARVFQRDL